MSDSRGELLEKNVKIIGENNTPVTITHEKHALEPVAAWSLLA